MKEFSHHGTPYRGSYIHGEAYSEITAVPDIHLICRNFPGIHWDLHTVGYEQVVLTYIIYYTAVVVNYTKCSIIQVLKVVGDSLMKTALPKD